MPEAQEAAEAQAADRAADRAAQVRIHVGQVVCVCLKQCYQLARCCKYNITTCLEWLMVYVTTSAS